MIKSALAALILVLPLAACGGGPPWTLAQSPDGITLRWYSDDTSIGEANNAAGRYCASMGKSAALGGLEQDGSASIGTFHCV
jgi:hypothetical protein